MNGETPVFTPLTTCLGCDHSMRGHFVSVTGDVVCIVSNSGVSSSGVTGIPWTTHCDCVNYKSPDADRRREYEAREKEEDERHTAEMVAAIRAHMTLPIPPLTPEVKK